MMMLLTKENIRNLPKLYTHDGKQAKDVPVAVKFFCPWNQWTWYVTEGQQDEDGDWLFFGLVHGIETELGYFRLSELQSVTGPGGLKIERDRSYAGTLEEALKSHQ